MALSIGNLREHSMNHQWYPNQREVGPNGIYIPTDLNIKVPGMNVSEGARAFFGKTGMWWGTWRSPQVKGSYDAVLIVREIRSDGEAEIVYLTPDYPNWYITAERLETRAVFVTREDGRFVLRIPYVPAATTMDFWFEGIQLKGITYGRFMRRDIVLKPLR